MSKYEILQPVHLGNGELGEARKRALAQLAAEAGYFWGDGPSVGRWLISLADEKIKENKMASEQVLYAIDNGVGAQPIQLQATGRKELIDIPGGEKCCITGCGNRATRSVTVVDSRSGTFGSICFEHRHIDPNFGRTEWPHPSGL